MDSRKDDDVGDGVAIPADVVDGQPPQANHDDSGQDDSGGQSPQVHGIDGVQEQHSLNMDGEGGGELDAAGSDGEGQDAIDAHGDQAANMLSNEQPEDSNELIAADVNQTGLNQGEEAADQTGLHQGEDAAEALQQEVNELKIELLSSHRNLDEAHERELDLQRQLHELTNQRTAEARIFAEKTARLENRVGDLQHQLQEASRVQQPSPSSDLRIRVAEVQELKARIKQYEIKLASSEEISIIRKEADMDRIKTDASWQHRMLSDQISRLTASLSQGELENKRLQAQLFKATRECVSSVEECNQLRRRLAEVSTSAKRVFASQNQQREEILRDIGTLANSPLKDTSKIMESLSAVSAPPAGKKKLAIENGAMQPKPPAKSVAAAKGSPKKAAHRSDASEDAHIKSSAPDFMAFMPPSNGFGGPEGAPNVGAMQAFDGVRAYIDPAMPPNNFNLDGDSFWTSPPKQVPGKR